MQPPADLDPYDYDFHEDPYPYYKRLRDEAPLYRNDERKFWALSRHKDVVAGFRNSVALSNKHGVSLDPISRNDEAHRVMSFLALDDPGHLRLRTLVSKGFTPRRIRELEAGSPRSPVQHLDAALQNTHLRLRRRVRGQAADGRHLRADGCARTRTGSGSAHWPTGSCTARTASPTCPTRPSRPPASCWSTTPTWSSSAASALSDDLTSALVEAEIDGDQLTDDEIMAFLFLMVVAGNETTTKLLANAAYWGYKNPDQLAPVFDDHDLVTPWVEETLRYDTSSQILARAGRRGHDVLRHHGPGGRCAGAA